MMYEHIPGTVDYERVRAARILHNVGNLQMAARQALVSLARQDGFTFGQACALATSLEYPEGSPETVSNTTEALRAALEAVDNAS